MIGKGKEMAWNLIPALKAARDAAFLGADATINGNIPGLFKHPDLPVGRQILKDGKRDGFEVDRENLLGDWGQIGLCFRSAVEQLWGER